MCFPVQWLASLLRGFEDSVVLAHGKLARKIKDVEFRPWLVQFELKELDAKQRWLRPFGPQRDIARSGGTKFGDRYVHRWSKLAFEENAAENYFLKISKSMPKAQAIHVAASRILASRGLGLVWWLEGFMMIS